MNAKDITRPTVFPDKTINSILGGARPIQIDGTETFDSNAHSTSSFTYDPPSLGLKSTQQLNVDWSKFENHTFFNSAEVSVNVAFDRIINGFPFDGTRREFEVFFEGLTGFEKYVYDLFPKNIGYLLFSGTKSGEDTNGTKGTFISVNDYAGGLLPALSKNKTGQNIIDPGINSLSIELQLYLPTITNDIQVICQKLSGSTQGFSLFLQKSTSTSTCNLTLATVSGSSFLLASASLTKGQFNHVCVVYNRETSLNQLQIFNNEALVFQTTSAVKLGAMDITPSSFVIGSGTLITAGTASFLPLQTLSGAIDELRVFHSARTLDQVQKLARKSIFASDDLVLYYKFNEPYGTLGSNASDDINRVVLDSSGNSLHSYISSAIFSTSLRNSSSITVPMTLEKLNLSPVLFPSFTSVVALNTDLLASASIYDDNNPNIITKLIPPHYLTEGQKFDGLPSENGNLVDTFQGSSGPGSGQLGSTQTLLSLLYVWAKFFDELKLFVDAFSTLHFVNYNQTNTAPDHFLPLLIKQFGFHVPPFFLDASIEQYIDAENIQPVISTDQYSLQYVQNQILRRVLTNMLEVVRSKGTQHSIKAFLRTVGINPDNSFRIREFGGPTKQQLSFVRESKTENALLLDFVSGGFAQSPYLTASRTETGYPGPAGTMSLKTLYYPHGISNNANDGLFTSGSWTYEAAYCWPNNRAVSSFTQSLVRIETTGSLTGDPGLIFNLVALTSSSPSDLAPRVTLYGRPTLGVDLTLAPLLEMTLTGVNLFDGNKWNVAFGRFRNDAINSFASSSWFLHVGTQEFGEIKQLATTSSYYRLQGTSPASSCSLYTTSTSNISGAFLCIGSASLPFGTSTANFSYLNNTATVAKNAVQGTKFNGQVSRIRFWTKGFSIDEWKEHVRNFKSLGVYDPTTNFNFETVKSGAWERLRIDVAMEQDTARSTDASGLLRLFDFSQNNMHFSASLFPTSSQVLQSSLWPYSLISPVIDEASTNEKVRIRSYQDFSQVKDTPWAGVAPVYQINPAETPSDDTRFSIEFSLMDALNRDVVNIFSTLTSLDNALGDPELLFSPDYPTLEVMRNLYFNRLTDKVNLKQWFEFFRWFSISIGDFIEQLIPRKTRFFGTNFIIESHMLERPKFEYSYSDIYLSEQTRPPTKDVLLLQLIAGTLHKF